MTNHLEHACPLRPVTCPFFEIGCCTTLVAQDVSRHMEDCQLSHQMLMSNHIVEQNHTIKSLFEKNDALELRLEESEAKMTKTIGMLTALSATVDSFNGMGWPILSPS